MSTCPLCETRAASQSYDVPGSPLPTTLNLCEDCVAAIADPASHAEYWRVLETTMWSEVSGVNVMADRILRTLSGQAYAADLRDMLYLDDDARAWSEAADIITLAPTIDSNGTPLSAGDTVTLIKDLPVKGAGFTAKRGTTVRGISLTDNPLHIEGRVNGQRIVLVAAFLKKST